MLTAFSWADSSQSLYLAGFLTDDLLVGQLGSRSESWRLNAPAIVLVDLTSGTVHPVEGVEETEIDYCHCLWFSRPASGP